MPLLPITASTATPWRASVSSSLPAKPKAPSPSSRTTRPPGPASLAASRQRAVQLRRDRSRVGAIRLGRGDHHDLAVVGERAPEPEPEVERDADHERDVGAAERRAAGAGEAELVVGRKAAAPEAVQEHR